MFNAQNSAYGRGITANLVTEEQRVKYNTGGRVQLAEGSWYGQGWDKIKNIFNKGTIKGQGFTMKPGYTGTTLPATISKTPKISERALWEAGKKHWPKAWGAIKQIPKRFPAITTGLAGAYVTDPEDWEEEMGISRWDKIKRDLTPWAGTKKKIEQYQDWKKMKKDDEKLDDIEVEEVGIEEKVDPISDTLDWTDQEKKEKMGQILLKGGQRLVSGARDKWGSKEQMKNIGDWMGDVAAIGDKTELRKEERKYQAWAKAKKSIARDVQASTLEYNNLRAQGVSEAKALDISTGGKIKAKTIPSSTNKKLRRKALETTQKGDIIYDEDIQAFTLSGYIDEKTGKSKPVPREKLVDFQKIFLKQGA